MDIGSPLVKATVDDRYLSPENRTKKKTQKESPDQIQKFPKILEMDLMDSSSKQRDTYDDLDERKLEMSFAPCKRKTCTYEQDVNNPSEITAFQYDLQTKFEEKTAETPDWNTICENDDLSSLAFTKDSMAGSSSFCRLLNESEHVSMDKYQSLPPEEEPKIIISKKVTTKFCY